ncbi:peptidase U62 modulator of DNA gyrase [Thalassoporum mexicanum PCC 7367]|uniref:TldD/PmbA family protein n=1 Tax=Thalassoporum mexicanum TaxID=3457544 RepID=UPI00029FC390|nr:TldD/PmbA family protein [Pseudanabaena sp. PCC 7367]AFY69017.1 peptidase U62 modulator of DNA gyrase [Pseudanabaena sp. PCC 7367]
MELTKALAQLDLNAEWVGLRELKETATARYFRDAQPQSNGRTSSHGVMVEVLADGQFGYASTNRLDQGSLQFAAEKAYQQAIAAAKWSVHKFTTAARPKAVGQFCSPCQKPFNSLSTAEISDLLVQICEAMKTTDRHNQIVRTSAYVVSTETESRLVSSSGSDVYQKFGLVSTDYNATAQDGDVIQKRSDNGSLARNSQAGWEVLDPELVIERARQIGTQAIELLTADECPTTTTNLLLAADQMLLQIHESVGHPLELDRILGDERNYAGSSFIKLADFGQLQYGSPLMNITFDPTVSGEFASYAYDDTGAAAEKQYLIKDGLLLRGLGSLESQARSGVAGVANARANSWNRPAIDRMANINLEPGNSSVAEMIASVDYGVYMQSNRSWSIDDYRNKFQFGCEYAQLIENGQITKTLRNPNYRGITNQFWGGLKMVGDRDSFATYGTPYCGKGEPNQVIRVGHGTPACLFENIEVFGGNG